MKIRELTDLITKIAEWQPSVYEKELAIVLNKPNIGGCAKALVKSIANGFDWDNGYILLRSEEPLVEKTDREEVFDASWDFIFMLSVDRGVKGRQSWASKEAEKVARRVLGDVKYEAYAKTWLDRYKAT